MAWILRSIPADYDLGGRLATDCWIIDWTIHPTVRAKGGQSAVTIGDPVWFAILDPPGTWGTIHARGRVLSKVVNADEPQRESAFANPPGRFAGVAPRMYVEITDHVRPPLPLANVRQVPGLANMQIFGGFQATAVFWVTPTEAPLLENAINAQQAGAGS